MRQPYKGEKCDDCGKEHIIRYRFGDKRVCLPCAQVRLRRGEKIGGTPS